MICLRCGYCCISYDVVIVKPEHAATTNLKNTEHLMIKKGGEKCPHLSWSCEQAVCGVHNRKWYKKTPCYSHGQIEQSKDCECRMGRYLIDKKIKPEARSMDKLACYFCERTDNFKATKFHLRLPEVACPKCKHLIKEAKDG